jgi:hypothetical protein
MRRLRFRDGSSIPATVNRHASLPSLAAAYSPPIAEEHPFGISRSLDKPVYAQLDLDLS